jgi:hypothetical protein
MSSRSYARQHYRKNCAAIRIKHKIWRDEQSVKKYLAKWNLTQMPVFYIEERSVSFSWDD